MGAARAGDPAARCAAVKLRAAGRLLAGKRLLTNREWQGAAAGTPDPGTDNLTTDCAVNSPGPVNTGSWSSCKSSWGVFDMVGNVAEWVADWADRNNVGCTDWTSQTGIAGGDISCFGGDGSGAFNQIPGALFRGGYWGDGSNAGVVAAATGWGHDGDAGGRRAASAWHSATTTRHDHGVARARTGEHAGVESEGIAHEGDRQHAPVVDGAGPNSLLSHLFREE